MPSGTHDYLSLVHVQVDGEEDIKKGVDLMEFSQILQSVGCWQAVVSSYLTHLTKSNTFTACDIIIVISIEVVLQESHCTSEYIRTLTALNY